MYLHIYVAAWCNYTYSLYNHSLFVNLEDIMNPAIPQFEWLIIFKHSSKILFKWASYVLDDLPKTSMPYKTREYTNENEEVP